MALMNVKGHAAADDNLVNLVRKVFEHADLARDFRPAEDTTNGLTGSLLHP